jgi:hypothetical protein
VDALNSSRSAEFKTNEHPFVGRVLLLRVTEKRGMNGQVYSSSEACELVSGRRDNAAVKSRLAAAVTDKKASKDQKNALSLSKLEANTIASSMARMRHQSFKEGMPIIITRNIDMKRGLVNGKRGRFVCSEKPPKDALFNLPMYDVKEASFGRAIRMKPTGMGYRRFLNSFAESELESATVQVSPLTKKPAEIATSLTRQSAGSALTKAMCPTETIHFRADEEVVSDGAVRLVLAKFTMPLDESFAMTANKAQSLTIDSGVYVRLGEAFSSGAAYVQLSRATNSKSLLLASDTHPSFFGPNGRFQTVFADKDALEFMSTFN